MESQSSALATSARQPARKCCWPAVPPLSGWNGCATNARLAMGAGTHQFAARTPCLRQRDRLLRSRAIVCQAYDTVTSILAAAPQDHQRITAGDGLAPASRAACSGSAAAGSEAEDSRRTVLRNRRRSRDAPGAGRQGGIPFRRNRGLGGHASDGRPERLETVLARSATARGQLPRHGPRFATGDRWSLVYWNDVLQHIPPDEISDWLADPPPGRSCPEDSW